MCTTSWSGDASGSGSSIQSFEKQCEDLVEKNRVLEEEVRRLKGMFRSKEVDLTELRSDEPEIATLLENNRKWVKAKLVRTYSCIYLPHWHVY
jgi:chromosome segregation ATPase